MQLSAKKAMTAKHRDQRVHLQRANMHYQGITCTNSTNMGLKSAEDPRLICVLNGNQIIFFKYYEN
jgi:hypothetical protein